MRTLAFVVSILMAGWAVLLILGSVSGPAPAATPGVLASARIGAICTLNVRAMPGDTGLDFVVASRSAGGTHRILLEQPAGALSMDGMSARLIQSGLGTWVELRAEEHVWRHGPWQYRDLCTYPMN